MFALFGEIVFVVLGSPDTFTSSRRWDYAEHQVVEDRTKLQWLADGLETIALDFHFHVSFTDPSLQAAALIAAASDHNARPLVFGNGVHRGYFVVTSIQTIARQMSANGNLIALTVRAELKEWAFDAESEGSPTAWFPLLGIVAALPGVTTGSIGYAGGSGVGATPGVGGEAFVAPSISAPGVSPILNLPAVAGLTAPHLNVDDVPPSTIVRASR